MGMGGAVLLCGDGGWGAVLLYGDGGWGAVLLCGDGGWGAVLVCAFLFHVKRVINVSICFTLLCELVYMFIPLHGILISSDSLTVGLLCYI